MTLLQLIDRHEEPQAAPAPLDFVPAAVALTARGDAALALYRLIRQLRALDAEDRAYIFAMLGEEIRPMIAGLAAGA